MTLSLLIAFNFISTEKVGATTVSFYTDTGHVYLTAGLTGTVPPGGIRPSYSPGEPIYADVVLDLGFAYPTAIDFAGGANGGYANFDLQPGIVRTLQIGNAQSTSGTYNAGFSYQYNQQNIYVTIGAKESMILGFPNKHHCSITVETSERIWTPLYINADIVSDSGNSFGNVSIEFPAGENYMEYWTGEVGSHYMECPEVAMSYTVYPTSHSPIIWDNKNIIIY